MITTYSYNSLTFKFPVYKAFSSCSKEIEEKVPSVESIHFNVKKSERADANYRVELRAFSDKDAVYSSVDTKNIIKGLAILKRNVIQRFRQSGKKFNSKVRRMGKRDEINFTQDTFVYKEAK